MTIRLLLALAVGSTVLLHAAPAFSDIILHNGQKFTGARIAAIANGHATIVHAGGVTSVDVEQIDLEVLARAQIRLEAESAARAAKEAEAAQKIADRNALQRDELAERMAAAAVREKAAQAPAKKAHSPHAPLPSMDALKQSFPPPARGAARVFIPKAGQGGRPRIVSSTLTEIQGGPSLQSTRMESVATGRIDSIQYQAPSEDMWRWYKGMFQTTTLAALPRTLQMVEARMAEDIEKCQVLASGASASGQAQGRHSLHWIEKQLKPHVAEWRKLVR